MLLDFEQVPERLDKNFIFSRVSDEDIFQFYGIPLNNGTFCSPLRQDRHPTCSFYRSPSGILYYRDWGAADHYFDAIGFVMYLYSLSFTQALHKIWNDMIVKNPSLQVVSRRENVIHVSTGEACKIQVKRRSFSTADITWWLQYGITEDALFKYGVSSIKRAWLDGRPHYIHSVDDPCYAYHFGPYQYKLYFPKRTKYRFLSSSNKIQGWDQLPSSGNWLVITKSMKDVMLLDRFNVPAIALASESEIPSIDLINVLKERFKNIVVVYDNDKQGILSMQKAKEHLPCMWLPRLASNRQKDISDYYKHNGHSETNNLITYAKNKLSLWQGK
jgi:hypothetical protein